MRPTFSSMSTPPPNSGPQPGYGAPPPNYGMPPKKNNTAKILLIVLAVVFGGGIFVVAILAAILFPVFQKVRGNAQRSSCLTNVRRLEIGMAVYTQDHNGKFPPSAAACKDAIADEGMNATILHCPADQNSDVSYSLNTNLQGLSLDDLTHPDQVVAIYEGKNQTLNFRHDGKAVVGFVDGHDKAYTRAEAASLKWTP